MCGIAGIAGTINNDDEILVKKMTRMLSHRGPDDENFYLEQNAALGHRRLSVIDLESGRQPLANEDRTIWTIFNGEIYNFQELQKDLIQKGHSFRTRTDTEVIVHSYEEYENFIEKLDGMFAFAIWDSRKKKLILARDRIGKKPLYYSHTNEKIYFASELKALLCCPEISRDLDTEAVHHFLSLNYVPEEFSLIKKIRKLPPGHSLIYQDAQIQIKPYWQMPVQNTSDLNTEESALEVLKDNLLRAVKKRLISDVPLGVFASGGIDSNLVLACLRDLGVSKIKTFTIGFSEKAFDESARARAIAKHFNTDHHEYIVNTQLSHLLPKIIWYSDEPSADQSSFPTFLLSELAKKEITVALSGDGGDEFFAGYNTYMADAAGILYKKLPLFFREKIALPLSGIIPSSSHAFTSRIKKFIQGGILSTLESHFLWNGTFAHEEKLKLYSADLKDKLNHYNTFKIYSDLAKGCSFKNPLDLCMYIDQKSYLPDDILVKVDRMSMAHGLEVRSPLLDLEVIRTAYRIPANLKLRHGSKKYILKKLLSQMIPPHLFSNRKKGFSIPVNQWLRKDLKPLLQDALCSKKFTDLGLFDSKQIQKLMEDHFKQKARNGSILWTLMTLAIWNEQIRDRQNF